MKNNKFSVVIGIIIILSGLLVGFYKIKQSNHNSIVNTKPTEIKDITKENKPTEIKEDKVVIDDRHFKEGKLKTNKEGIPVLMYHSIDYEKDNPLRIPKEQFREQMKYLKDNGYTVLSLNELYNFFEKDEPVPEKSVVLTFDDGYVDNYVNAFPTLKEFGFTATIFIITNTVDTNNIYLNSKQIKEMVDNGIDIESHTVDHEDLDKLNYEKQLEELKNSKAYLEKLLNKDIKYIAYPTGKYNKDTLKAAKESGYLMAVTTNGTWSDKSDGIYTLDRVYISANASKEEFIRRITNRNYK